MADPVLPPWALTRAGEAPPIAGNEVTLLRDGPEVFPAWIQDIASAQHFVLFENYIFNNDRTGNAIADALIERAAAGVAVHLLYDWFGCIGTSRRLWRRLAEGGVDVRVFNPPRLSDPIRSVQRNHRKSLCVDGRIGYVGGLCVGDAWAGDPAQGIPPWRDTAVRIVGPAAVALCRAFNETWSAAGPPLPAAHLPPLPPPDKRRGGAPVRVISGLPGRSRIYRIIQVLLSLACRRIWLTDAYFLTPPPLYEALLAAARDGVDVRVLVPGRSDLPWVSWIGRAGYTGLLRAGVRIFEWEGPMLHAKTSVIDGLWCRVGSSNLNLASLLTNWELDVTVEDATLARAMEEMFLEDIGNARELILRTRRRRFQGHIQRAVPVMIQGSRQPMGAGRAGPSGRRRRDLAPPTGRAGAAMARASAAVLGAALRRQFEQNTWSVAGATGALLLGAGGLGLWQPRIVGGFLSLLLIWFGVAALGRAVGQWWRQSRRQGLWGRTRALLRGHLQQAKGREVSQRSPPPNQTEP
ncbi:MAG: phospholipase D-like domain-containing protein [Myxococcales bacterium]|nr:phospholipase D-like domain-containing protein [Myxococcota bacterium]MDW8281971.1 phospholipase D-like domain-containing protein [Myxococcales bacterium]